MRPLEPIWPGAVGIGWDLGTHGLGPVFCRPAARRTLRRLEAVEGIANGKEFMSQSGEFWRARACHQRSGSQLPQTYGSDRDNRLLRGETNPKSGAPRHG